MAGEPLERSVALRAADVENQAADGPLACSRRTGSSALTRLKGREALETGPRPGPRDGRAAASLRRSAKAHHRRLAHALEAWGLADPEALALHFHAAEEPETAAEYVTGAARQASEALAFDRAARLYRVALNLGAGEKEIARPAREPGRRARERRAGRRGGGGVRRGGPGGERRRKPGAPAPRRGAAPPERPRRPGARRDPGRPRARSG